MTTHTNCSHPATKAARAACRKAAGSTVTPRVTVAKAAAEALPAIRSIKWDRETCDRCGGTGRYPSAMWNGVCLGCSGVGDRLTRSGKAAVKKYDAFLAANYSKAAIDLQPGDKIFKQGRWVTVHAVDIDFPKMSGNGFCTIGAGDNAYSFCSIHMSYTTKMKQGGEIVDVINHVAPFGDVIVKPASLQDAFRHVANMKGALIEYAD
jgi:hypothetical protein